MHATLLALAAAVTCAGCANRALPPEPAALTSGERESAAAIAVRFIQDEFAPRQRAIALDGQTMLKDEVSGLLRAAGYATEGGDAVTLAVYVDAQDTFAVVHVDGPAWSAARFCSRHGASLAIAGPLTIFRDEPPSDSEPVVLPLSAPPHPDRRSAPLRPGRIFPPRRTINPFPP